MRFLLILTVVISFLGCIPYADTPLTDAGVQPLDDKLLGTWYWKEDSDSGYIHIGLDETAKMLRLVLVEFGQDGALASSEFGGHTTMLKGKSYLNLKRIRPEKDQEPGYLFIKYTLKHASLGISIMNSAVVANDIESGALMGTVTRGEWASTIHMTASQEKLQQYIVKQDNVLFLETTYLPKLALP